MFWLLSSGNSGRVIELGAGATLGEGSTLEGELGSGNSGVAGVEAGTGLGVTAGLLGADGVACVGIS